MVAAYRNMMENRSNMFPFIIPIYQMLNSYVAFLRTTILLGKPHVSFANLMGLLVGSMIANTIGDRGMFWLIVFGRLVWLLILKKDEEDFNGGDIQRHSMIGSEHWTA